MKIILLNYRYFVSGGPERYMFNIKSILEQNGHEVIPFSVKHNKNEPTPYESYFMDPIGTGNETYGHEYKRDLKTVSKVISRIIYSFEAKDKLKKLIKDINPDLLYIVYFQNKMSCSIVDAAKEMGIPVVMRISDFGQMCQHSNSGFYLSKRNEICERCLQGSILNNIKYKCADDSLVNSIIKTASLYVMRALHIKEKVNAFVFPSSFTMSKYIEFGVTPDKANYIPTFFNKKLINSASIQYNPYALYIGRLVPEKGILTMLKAFVGTNRILKIIGAAADLAYEQELKDYLKDKQHNIEFLGEMPFNQIQQYLLECLFTIIPSEWYENMPNTILESYAFKKCVIATDIGSLKESIIHNETGMLFEYKNAEDLRQKAEILFDNPLLAKQYGEAAYEKIESIYSAETHYNKLIAVFNKVLAAKPVFN